MAGLGPMAGGNASRLNVAAPTLVKASEGVVVTVAVLTAGSAAGGVYDFGATTGYAAANLVAPIPAAIGVYSLNAFPCFTGILIVPGTGQTVSVAFS